MTILGEARIKPVRVAIIDDSEDVRAMLRFQFSQDERFSVVGEGGDGHEAIAVAERMRPDLMILDQMMPELTGLEAIPKIRRMSPETAIILYTAQDARGDYQAALAAGAIEVLEKIAVGRSFVDQLVDMLAETSAAGRNSTIEVRVGPVSTAAARVWVANTMKIIDAVAAHPEVLGASIPDDVIDLFRTFLEQWRVIAEDGGEFRWVARARPADVERIVSHWAVIDAMTDEQLDELGVAWSPPEGAVFFEALTTGVLEAMDRHEDTKRLAERVGAQWSAYLSEAR